MHLASYSIAFDACFGREGAAEAVAAASSSGTRLEMTEGGEEGRDMLPAWSSFLQLYPLIGRRVGRSVGWQA